MLFCEACGLVGGLSRRGFAVILESGCYMVRLDKLAMAGVCQPLQTSQEKNMRC